MSANLAAANKKFTAWKKKLFAEHEEISAEADKLADGIIDCRTASAEQIWEKLWDKPLHTNQDGHHALEQTILFAANVPKGVWKEENLAGDYFVEQIPAAERPMVPDRNGILRRQSGRLNNSFRNPGAVVTRLLEGGIAYQRSNAIFNAGRHLRAMSLRGTDYPFSYLHDLPLADAVQRLQEGLGYGWGHITILHFLTDLGLACKPDRHVIRTMAALGLFTCRTNNATINEALEINRLARQLLPLAYGGSTSRRDLRHMDKVLMEISNRGLLGEN